MRVVARVRWALHRGENWPDKGLTVCQDTKATKSPRVPLSIRSPWAAVSLSEHTAKSSRTTTAFFFLLWTFHTTLTHAPVRVPPPTPPSPRLLTRHSMAVKVVPYGLLELMIRRPFLEPLVKKMPQVLVESSPCRKFIKQTGRVSNRNRAAREQWVGKSHTHSHPSQPPRSSGDWL